ncbi:MAG: hypothetical protein HY763_04580 [Planctomycetes bacterium]|nr:hypothetical protein [Planctomycetota bacterium]
MPKTKHGPALFELLDRKRQDAARVLRVPRWWSGARGARPAGGGKAAGESPEAGTDRILKLTPGGSPETPDARGERPEHRAEHEPLLEVDGRRIRLSFTSLTAAVAVFLGLMVLVAAYALGSRSGMRAGMQAALLQEPSQAEGVKDEVQEARSQPPATHLVGTLLDPPTATKSPPAEPAAAASPSRAGNQPIWTRGLTYILAQEFAGQNVEAADRAQAFLAEHGIASTVVRSRGGAVHLMVTQGFDTKDPKQKESGEQLLQKLRAVGAKYYASGGGYKLEGYFKTLKGDTW